MDRIFLPVRPVRERDSSDGVEPHSRRWRNGDADGRCCGAVGRDLGPGGDPDRPGRGRRQGPHGRWASGGDCSSWARRTGAPARIAAGRQDHPVHPRETGYGQSVGQGRDRRALAERRLAEGDGQRRVRRALSAVRAPHLQRGRHVVRSCLRRPAPGDHRVSGACSRGRCPRVRRPERRLACRRVGHWGVGVPTRVGVGILRFDRTGCWIGSGAATAVACPSWAIQPSSCLARRSPGGCFAPGW